MKTKVPECKIIFHQVLFILSHRLVMPLAKLLFSKITSVQNFEFIAIVSKTLYFLTLTLNLPYSSILLSSSPRAFNASHFNFDCKVMLWLRFWGGNMLEEALIS